MYDKFMREQLVPVCMVAALAVLVLGGGEGGYEVALWWVLGLGVLLISMLVPVACGLAVTGRWIGLGWRENVGMLRERAKPVGETVMLVCMGGFWLGGIAAFAIILLPHFENKSLLLMIVAVSWILVCVVAVLLGGVAVLVAWVHRVAQHCSAGYGRGLHGVPDAAGRSVRHCDADAGRVGAVRSVTQEEDVERGGVDAGNHRRPE